MSDKIAFSALNNDFTVHADPIIMSAPHGSVCRGRIGWESLSINGVKYPEGEAWVLYRSDRGFWLDLSLYAGISGRREFSDSARKKLTEALLSAPEAQHVFVVPTLDEVNEYVLERATNRAFYEVSMADGVNRIIQDTHAATEAVSGVRARSPYSLPKADGMVTEKDVRRAHFEGLIQAANAELERMN